MSKTKNFLPMYSDTKIRQTLKDAGGHVKTAASALGVGFSSYYARLKAMRENGSPVMTAAAAALAKKTSVKKAATAGRKAAVKKRKAVIKKARVEKRAIKKAPAKKKAPVKKKR